MFLSRIELDAARATPRELQLLATVGGAHRLVWSWFSVSTTQARDFLFRLEPGVPRVWTLSPERPPHVPPTWRCSTREFAPQLGRGDRLRFLVTVNPTVRTKIGPGAGKRHDVVMHEKTRLRDVGEGHTEAEVAQRAGTAWLVSRGDRLGCSFEAPTVQVDRYRVERFHRDGGPPASIAMLDLTGMLTVIDPQQFIGSVLGGIGPSKAFGCGLMLLRRL